MQERCSEAIEYVALMPWVGVLLGALKQLVSVVHSLWERRTVFYGIPLLVKSSVSTEILGNDW